MTEIIIDPRGDLSQIDLAIQFWLNAKQGKSHSDKTLTAYRDTIASFRAALQGVGQDLYSNPAGVALTAQAWAAHSLIGREVSPATYNQRLACVSSFYVYAKKQGMYESENPIGRVERRKVQAYAGARPLESDDLSQHLKTIPRDDLMGQRDYALLSIALTTGRRISELAALHWRDIQLTDNGTRAIVTWRRAKGGKVMTDKLTLEVTRALLVYLKAAYPVQFGNLPTNAPIWLSTSHRNAGQALGIQTISDICQRRLGTSKVHALRHTFAHAMEQAGAKVSEIQARLGHESLATTGRYLASLSSADNSHAEAVAGMFGID
ncbi:MAG: tyrosine-type recombinase/integrase [Chloroflexota bacterium]